jgi:hypothetical protein
MLVPSHAGLAAFLGFCGASGAFAVLFYEPVIDRAAFPEPN